MKHGSVKKRILFVGGGDSMARAVVTAGRLGYQTVAVDNKLDSPVVTAAQEGIAANISNPVELCRVARSVGIDGIYPSFEPAGSGAAAELNLPGLPADAAELMQDKFALRQALSGSGVSQPTFCAAADEAEAVAAAETVRLPVVVKPARGGGSKGVRRVDHLADVTLAFGQSKRAAPDGVVLVESFVEGRHVTVDGTIQCGSFRPVCAHGSLPAPAPRCYEEAVYAPLEDELLRELVSAADGAAKALKIIGGFFSAEFICSAQDFFLIELHPYPSHLVMPADLLELTAGVETAAAVLRACTGAPPAPSEMAAGGRVQAGGSAAIQWIDTHSGYVMAVEGLQEARAVPGVREVRVAAKPGDRMGHVVDVETRDRVGYAVATGNSAGEALDAAREAASRCKIVTSPALA